MNEDGFWSRVDKTGECWLWTAAQVLSKTTHATYRYGILQDENRERWLAHRYSYRVSHGRIPRHLLVLHSCDNGLCVNPKHLRLGTQRENIQEASNKGHMRHTVYRGVRGSRNVNAKLTEKDVLDIRAAVLAGATQLSLARTYGVCDAVIWRIIHRKSWTHI